MFLQQQCSKLVNDKKALLTELISEKQEKPPLYKGFPFRPAAGQFSPPVDGSVAGNCVPKESVSK